MNGKEKIDFFEYGKKFAMETIDIIKKKANEIEEKYGEQAKLEFESGYAAYFPVFGEELEIDNFDINNLGGKREGDYGIPNTRNNSYFGRKGISFQCGKNGYREPNRKR